MLRLTQTFGAHAGRVIDLEREVIRFGRLPDNEVAFDPHADLDASGRHAEIRREGPQYVLVDSGSRNGTLVAGRRITRHILNGGEEIEFGVGGPRVRIEMLSPPRGAVTSAAAPIGVETAAATPVAIKSSPPSPNDSISPVQGPRPTPPPSPFSVQAQVPLHAPPPQGVPPPIGLPAMPAVPMPAPQAPAMSPSAPGGGEEKRFGQRTVGMMIQAALEQADRQRGSGPGANAEMMHAVAAEAAKRSSRGTKILIGLLTILVLIALGGVGGLFWYQRQQEHSLREENVRLQRQLADLDDSDTEERRRLESRIQQINDELSAPQEATGARIAEQNEGAVYLLFAEPTSPNARRLGICSAFAVRADLLATNAHCVTALERAMDRGQRVSAIPNRGGTSLGIARMWRHPMFVPEVPVPSPDVGLIRVTGTTRQQVRIASMPELARLRVGDDLFVYGFPGDVPNANTPVAVLTTGVVGRMTQFDGSDAQFPMRSLISHSAFTNGGLSGSPLFDSEGRVVAINAGNYRGDQRVIDPGTRMGRMLNTESAYAWAVRADLLVQLLQGLPAQ
jgi:V8-like Glu-specific endopeptidase